MKVVAADAEITINLHEKEFEQLVEVVQNYAQIQADANGEPGQFVIDFMDATNEAYYVASQQGQ